MRPRIHPLVPRRAPLRLLVAVGIGLAVTFGLARESWPIRIVSGWNALAFTMLCFLWTVIWRADAKLTKQHAAADDPGRATVWVVALLSCTFSLFAAVVLLRQARTLAPERASIWIVLCLIAVACSWSLTHTSWAMRYAHLFYREDHEGVGGLTFPGEQPPDAFDFAYFAFTVGICFQTSDVNVPSRQIRRSVLFHACQSFVYTTAIVALALNLVFGFVA